MLQAGLATHFVASSSLGRLEDALHSLSTSARDSSAVRRAIASVQVRPVTPAAGALHAKASGWCGVIPGMVALLSGYVNKLSVCGAAPDLVSWVSVCVKL